MWVVAGRDLAYVYAAGARNVATGTLGDTPGAPVMFSAERACVRLTVPTDTPGFAEALVLLDDCAAYIDVVLPAHHTNVCVADDAAACGIIMVSMPARPLACGARSAKTDPRFHARAVGAALGAAA